LVSKSAGALADQRADDAVANAYGLGRCRQAGFWATAGLRFLTACDGSADTTSGVSRVRSVRSIALISARGASESIGARKTRTASLSQTGHDDFGVAVPIGQRTSKSPSRTHRYWYVATRKDLPAVLNCEVSRESTTSGHARPRRLGSPAISEPPFRSKALREAMNRPLVRGGHIHPRDGCELLLTQSKRYQGMRSREWVFDLVVNL
jgi:hypothetical protein